MIISYVFTDPSLELPETYPVGCLLGCVDVTDVVAQDEYKTKVSKMII